MRRALAAIVILWFVALYTAAQSAATAGTWQIDPNHSSPQFAVRHLGISTVHGSFQKVKGTVQYDPADVSKTAIEATIDTTSITTNNDSRDKDLRSPNYFDVDKFPTMTFKSKKVEWAGGGKLKVTGDLTIKGVTREVVLNIDAPSDPIKDPRGNMHMGTEATTTISRKDFGVGGGNTMMIGDDIKITIDVEMIKQAAS
jgi:polyisoprenoid-binding protein YceI